MENICEWENCEESGKYKAPLEKDNSKNYKWLCKEHIIFFYVNYFQSFCSEDFPAFTLM